MKTAKTSAVPSSDEFTSKHSLPCRGPPRIKTSATNSNSRYDLLCQYMTALGKISVAVLGVGRALRHTYPRPEGSNWRLKNPLPANSTSQELARYCQGRCLITKRSERLVRITPSASRPRTRRGRALLAQFSGQGSGSLKPAAGFHFRQQPHPAGAVTTDELQPHRLASCCDGHALL